MARRSKLPTNGDGAMMAKTSATASAWGNRTRELDALDLELARLATGVVDGTIDLADAMRNAHALDCESPLRLALKLSSQIDLDQAFDAADVAMGVGK